jgi:hypothetical protein
MTRPNFDRAGNQKILSFHFSSVAFEQNEPIFSRLKLRVDRPRISIRNNHFEIVDKTSHLVK